MDFVEKLSEIQSGCEQMLYDVDIFEPSMGIAMYFIVFNPAFWNIVAHMEYDTQMLAQVAGSPRKGCYILAAVIFILGVGRDLCFHKALASQSVSPILDHPFIKTAGKALVGAGQVLVVSSMWQLGITGTYLGDYFGILMDHVVTSFPFNICNHPMYQGSTMSFLGYSLITGKPAGLVLTLLVHAMYTIAVKFEEPFTAKIYAERDAEKSKKSE